MTYFKLPSSITNRPLITNLPSISNRPSSIVNIPSAITIPQLWTGFATPPFRAYQSDFGQVLGGTLKATGTTPPVITIAGSAATSVAPRIEITTLGANGTAKFRYAADNGVNTFIESNVTVPTTPFTYAFIGALTGITATFANSTYATDNVYQGTLAASTDQITGTATLAQATATAQPIVRMGLNGHVSWLSDGVDDKLTDTSVDFPAPGTTPTFFLWGGRTITWTGATVHLGAGNAATSMCVLPRTASPNLAAFNGAFGPNSSGAAVNAWYRGECRFGNSTADYLKCGSVSVTGTNTGNTDPAVNFNLFADAPASGFSAIEVMFVMLFSTIPSGTELTNFATTINSAAMYNSLMGT